jgi:integrase/recombinase XerD
MTAIAGTLQRWFVQRLASEQHVSTHTIAGYRDSIRLLVSYLHDQHGHRPAGLDFEQLDATTIGAFLTWQETDRHASIRTRNVRLSAIRSFFTFASFHHPEHAQLIARVLAIPAKRAPAPTVTYLNPAEIDALIAAPDATTWIGRRDHCLLTLAIQTGLRVSELVALQRDDLSFGLEVISTVLAKAAATAPCRSPDTVRTCSPPGSANTPAALCSPATTSIPSPATRYAASSTATSPPPPAPAGR